MIVLNSFLVYITALCTSEAFTIRTNIENNSYKQLIQKRALQKSHEKPSRQKWAIAFFRKEKISQVPPLVKLLTRISTDYLFDCTPVILYDKFTEEGDNLLLEQFFRNYPLAYIHGQISENDTIRVSSVTRDIKTCISYLLFMKDVMKIKNVIGDQVTNKVIVVARSSQWRVYEFLASEISKNLVNLLVIAQSEKSTLQNEESAYILYSHKLYIDALGSSIHHVLTSWIKGKFTRPNVNLFPRKLSNGFAGHRFIISVADQPPFVIKRGTNNNNNFQWDGVEIRLINLLSKLYNFTTEFKEARDVNIFGSSLAVATQVAKKKADIGISGIYITQEIINDLGVSHWHSQDCASFISLTSIALPRYRAIMGPFHWTVWIALTSIYLLAIFPLYFSDKHSFKYLLKKPGEIENMFWYVFGTFTNCFTFVGQGSWHKADKVTTRILMGFYWLFTIIITACYTGSIIAFVTLPVYPSAVDTIEQLVDGRYQIGTLDKGGWPHWFANSSDLLVEKLLKKLDLVPYIEAGLKNTTKAFFWPYAFLGSKAQLDYIVRTNFTTKSKRSLLHISEECLAKFNIALIYPNNSFHGEIFNIGIMNVMQAGFMDKLKKDVEWITMRSATGKLLSANSGGGKLKTLTVEDRALTLDDTQGMFLLLGAGFLMGGASLMSEWFGGCINICKRRINKTNSKSSIESNPRSHERQTPRQKLHSFQYIEQQNQAIRNRSTVENHRPEMRNFTNHVDCIVHHNNEDCQESENLEASNASNIEEEVNRLFDFEDYFGEETKNELQESNEEIDESASNNIGKEESNLIGQQQN